MELQNLLYLDIFVWFIAFFYLVYITYKPNSINIGLSLIYFAIFSLTHFYGAFIYILPWFQGKQTGAEELTITGFNLSTYGLMAFILGMVLIGPLLQKLFSIYPSVKKQNNVNKNILENNKYLLLFGLFSYFVLLPFFQYVPSISAILKSGQTLILVSICIFGYIAISQNNINKLFPLVLLTFLFPVITIINQGFLGYGTVMTITVLIFFSKFLKIKTKHVIFILILFYFALSFYQTYMRDRGELRDIIWSDAGYSERIDVFINTFSEPEFFSPISIDHLDRIDERLNQNILVGAAIKNISQKDYFKKGETFKNAFLSLIPRLFWKDKPIIAGSEDMVSDATGYDFAEGTSVGVGQVLEFYINFGVISVIMGFIVIGILFYFFDTFGYIYLTNGNIKGFSILFVLAVSLTQIGGSLVEVTATAFSSAILVYLSTIFNKKYFSVISIAISFIVILLLIKKYYLPMIGPIYNFMEIIFLLILLFIAFLIFSSYKKRQN